MRHYDIPWGKLPPGKQVLVPYEGDEDRLLRRLLNKSWRQGQKHKRKFSCHQTEQGVLIRRTK